MSEHQPLQGALILIAEDEPLLAFEMMNVLLKAGAKVIGPAMSVERTLELVLAEKLTCAVLDVKLRDGLVFPAARLLRERGAGIVFHSAHIEPEGLKRDWPDTEVLSKPAPLRLLIPAILAACCGRGFGAP